MAGRAVMTPRALIGGRTSTGTGRHTVGHGELPHEMPYNQCDRYAPNRRMALAEVSIFQGLPAGDLALLEARSRVRKYRKNTQVLSRGDESDSLYIVVEGRVRIYRDDHDKEITLDLLGPGDCFGELAPLGDGPRSANAVTLTPATLRSVSKEALLSCIASEPELALRIIRLLVARLTATTDDLSSLALLDVYGRLARVLRKHARREGERLVVEQFSHRDLANMIGASREMVSP